MNREKQRIAIAEACGLVRGIDLGYTNEEQTNELYRPTPHGSYHDLNDRSKLYELEDDFDPLNSLDAMHETEKALNDGVLWGGYLNQLWSVVCPEHNQMNGLNAAVGLLLIHATAAQRAEAFLKTLGLWEEP